MLDRERKPTLWILPLAGVAVAIVAITLGLVAITGGKPSPAHRPKTTSASGGHRLATASPLGKRLSGASLYVNPDSAAVAAEASLVSSHQTTDAHLIQRIASQPVGTWFTTGTPQPAASVSHLVLAAHQVGKVPLLVAYYVPNRDCGGYSSGGAQSANAYLQWMTQFANGLAGQPAVVILEPDAVAEAVQGCLTGARPPQLPLVARAVTVLRRDPRALIYIDAGNAGWVTNLTSLASALRTAGIAHASGFALNVANFQSTAASTAYGTQVSHLLGGAHFVIDTSRNGNGSVGVGGNGPTWCNPPGRAVGRPPSTSTGDELIDAYLWIKPPGESDGPCRPGAPPAGQFWMTYALGLAAAG